MGWFLVNIILPVAVPAAFMLLARTANLPPSVAVRTNLLTLIQNGQLGWVALSFSASCAYEVFSHFANGARSSPIDVWFPKLLAGAIVLIAASGYLAALGALYPGVGRRVTYSWWRRYALLVTTAACTCAAAALYSVVHFTLTPS